MSYGVDPLKSFLAQHTLQEQVQLYIFIGNLRLSNFYSVSSRSTAKPWEEWERMNEKLYLDEVTP